MYFGLSEKVPSVKPWDWLHVPSYWLSWALIYADIRTNLDTPPEKG